jgi:hypothetical protein
LNKSGSHSAARTESAAFVLIANKPLKTRARSFFPKPGIEELAAIF